MKRFLLELRRREVFRTAGLYVGICWILIEGASIVLPTFDAPEWMLQAMIIAALIGFPVMLVLAWVYDVSDKGIVVQAEATDTIVLPFGDRKGDFIVIGVLAVALIFSVYLIITGGPEVAKEFEPVSVLIADFDNQTGDPLFDGSLEQALQIGIEGAAFITSFRRDVASKVAARLESAASLDAEMSRLVAVREGIKLVISGSIIVDGGGYEIAVRAIEPRDGEVIAKADTNAESKLQVLTAMERIANDLRRQLGDETLERDEITATETFTAKSLEAVREYVLAQSLQRNGQYAEAIDRYRKAIEYDQDFGRAYSGWAVAARGLGRADEAEAAWEKALALVATMTERERLRTLGMYYWGVTRNYQKAIETYETLVEKYPADTVGHNNLAVQYFLTLDFENARREGKIALDIYPNDTLTRSNYALYAMYASDFESAVAAVGPLMDQEEVYFKAWLPIAMDALAKGDLDAARNAYRSMSLTGDRGKSTAAHGLADLEIFAGGFAAARDILVNAIVEDEKIGSSYGMASKYMALAEAFFGLEDPTAGLEAIEKGMKLSGADAIAVPAALMSIDAGKPDAATPIADTLATKLQPQSRAYAELIRAVQQLEQGRHLEAIDKLTAAISVADLWLLRFYLGRAYLEGDFHAEALDEFMALQNRRGEATAIFLDDIPSYRYVATLPYWLARAQAEIGMTHDARQNFSLFLSRRPAGGPMADDARHRMK